MILKGHNVRNPGPRIQNYQVSSSIPRKEPTTQKDQFFDIKGCNKKINLRKLKAITIKVKTSHFKFHVKVGTMKSNGDTQRAFSENHLFM